jgi:hypothetical protein
VIKNQGRLGLPGGLHRLLSRNEKTTGAPLEPARGFVFYLQLSVNRLHPGQASRKSRQTKSKNP